MNFGPKLLRWLLPLEQHEFRTIGFWYSDDIERASSEALFSFERFHIAINRTIKSTTAAVSFTSRAVGEGSTASRLLSVLIEATGEPWGRFNHYNARKELEDASRFLAEMGVVRIHSAFDDFLTSVEAEMHRWRVFSTGQGFEIAAYADEVGEGLGRLRVAQLCDRYNWDWRSFREPLLVYRFFHLLRNCVAHRNGRLTEAVRVCMNEAEFIEAWRTMNTRRGTPPMSIPQISRDRVLLKSRDVILFSVVCRLIAIEVNRYVRNYLGEDGFLYMAAYHTLFNEFPITWGTASRTPEAVVNVALTNRFRISDVSTTATIAALRRIGIWDRCRQRHAELSREVRNFV